MISRIVILACISVSLFSCEGKKPKQLETTSEQTISDAKSQTAEMQGSATDMLPTIQEFKYSVEDDKSSQYLVIEEVSNDTISFDLAVFVKETSDTIRYSGKSIFTGNNSEIECCDDRGSSFPMAQFHFKGSCEFYILLNDLDRSRAKIIAFNCDQSEILTTGGVMRRVE